MPVDALHGAAHAVMVCQMPTPVGASRLSNVIGAAGRHRRDVGRSLRVVAGAVREVLDVELRRRRPGWQRPGIRERVGRATVVVVLGQVPVVQEAGLVDRGRERIVAVGSVARTRRP